MDTYSKKFINFNIQKLQKSNRKSGFITIGERNVGKANLGAAAKSITRIQELTVPRVNRYEG